MHAALLRTPGIVFQSVPQPAQPTLPPLDVAAFIGFAQRGPCDVAVPIEDLAGFDAIFGTTLALARTAAGVQVSALLRDAVASFFGAGGRRCHVVRVAGAAASRSRFAVPGLLAISGGRASVAAVEAAWPGGWSDDTAIGTVAEATPLPVVMFTRAGAAELDWNPASAPDAVQVGDVLRLTFGPTGILFLVASATARGSGFRLSSRLVLRWTTGLATSLPTPVAAAALLGGGDAPERPLTARLDGGLIHLSGDNAERVSRGDMLRIAVAGAPDRVVAIAAIGAVRGERVATPGDVIELPHAGTASATIPLAALDRVERLRFAFRIKDGTRSEQLVRPLGYNAGHPQFWGDIVAGASGPLASGTLTPGDATRLYTDIAGDQRADLDWTDARLRAVASSSLAPASPEPVYLPLGMPSFAGDLVGPIVAGSDALERFDERPFLDPSLAHAFPSGEVVPLKNCRALMLAATDRLFVQDLKLKGMHALLFIDEVALMSVPDAVQPGWQPGAQAELPIDVLPQPVPPPPAGFLACAAPLAIVSVSPATGPLHGGTEVTIVGSGFASAASLRVSIGGRAATIVTVLDDARIRCQTPPASVIGSTDVTLTAVAQTATLANAFSYVAGATVPDLPVAIDTTRYDPAPLITVHAALTVLCQARADAVAVLALPRHFEKRDCLDWQQRFRVALGLPASAPAPLLEPRPDQADLSYAAVYHPWLLVPDTLAAIPAQKALPPDGAACGLIAARELARQTWIAAANMPVPGVLDLEPAISDADWLDLFQMGFNLVRAEARDFRVMSAHTLADDSALLQLSVRRLLIQIRKALLERGNTYVFDSNTAAFRQRVRTGIEAQLRIMFNGGAFAGATEPQSFRVSIADTIDTPPLVADGQMIADIRVAPSQPMEFISVVLSRTGDGALQAAER